MAFALEEYARLRDRIETLRVRAGGQTAPAPAPMPPGTAMTVAVGAQIDVRLQTALRLATAEEEQRFEATTVVDYVERGTVVIPAGSIVRGVVSSVQGAGRVERRGSLTLSFDEIRIGNRSQRLRASVRWPERLGPNDSAGRIRDRCEVSHGVVLRSNRCANKATPAK